MNSSGDPFHMVRIEVENAMGAIEALHVEMKNTKARGANFEAIETKIEDSVRAVEWDLDQLQDTIRVVETNRNRFKLADAEVAQRRQSVASLRKAVERYRAALPRHAVGAQSAQSENMHVATDRENERFIDSEAQMQQSILNQQDKELDLLATTVNRIGVQGMSMGNGLEEQRNLLDALDDDIDQANNRFGVLQEKLNRIIEETGQKQFCLIFGLLLAFIVLTTLLVAS